MILSRLRLANWRQFKEVDVPLHPRLTILTGANGAGKTTLLNIIGQLYGWQANIVSTRRTSKGGSFWYFTGLWRSRSDSVEELKSTEIGSITFGDGHVAEVVIPVGNSAVYQIKLNHPRPVKGLNIPSHRSVYSHQALNDIPTAPKTKAELFEQYHNVVKTHYFNQHSGIGPSRSLKQALISLAVFGIGNEIVEPNPAARVLYEQFQDILRIVLPKSIGFQRFAVRMPEINFVTDTGEFSLDAVSGGTASIIDITWQIFTFAPENEPFVVTFDEPENHLHPELQARLLPSLIQAFPNAQFIVATHNPLIIGSEPNSSIVALMYDLDHRVIAQSLDLADKAGTANDILQNVLGLPYTMPIWAANRVEQMVASIRRTGITEASMVMLKEELSELGLSALLPATLGDLARTALHDEDGRI